jgi:hypothetical protein
MMDDNFDTQTLKDGNSHTSSVIRVRRIKLHQGKFRTMIDNKWMEKPSL